MLFAIPEVTTFRTQVEEAEASTSIEEPSEASREAKRRGSLASL